MAVNHEKTSFRQFEYCSFCRLNHKKGKKHLYSAKHRTIIHNILDKAQKKISNSMDTLSAPQVEPLGRPDMKLNFWCYFCVAEIARHEILDICVVKYGSMLDHIASEDHVKKTADFFRAHRVDESVRARDVHCLTAERLKAFKLLTVHTVRRFEERKRHQNKMIANKIREQEGKRRNHSQSEDWKTARQQQQFLEAEKLTNGSGYHCDCLNQPEGVSTLSAHSDGIAFIKPQEESNVKPGLRHCLQNNTEDNDQEIGPTLDDYQWHVAREQKKKQSAGRYGALFDDSCARSDSWLPSVGRACHSGHHLNSKKCFGKETKHSTHLGKRANREFLLGEHSGKQTGTDGTDTLQLHTTLAKQTGTDGTNTLQLHTTLAKPYQSKRQRSQNMSSCGIDDKSCSSSTITNNYNHTGDLVFSAEGSRKTMENSHQNS